MHASPTFPSSREYGLTVNVAWVRVGVCPRAFVCVCVRGDRMPAHSSRSNWTVGRRATTWARCCVV
jgi:hypothetical protein